MSADRGVGLARCWVLREQPVGCCLGACPGRVALCGRAGRGGGLRVVSGSRTARVLRGWCRRGRVWRVGRCLRTAQWTRASLNSLCGQVYKGTGWMPWH